VSKARFLVVNADDLGLSRTVNDGILAAHSDGIVTSASLMVRQGAAQEAAERAVAHPDLAIGLHLDLGEWNYMEGDWTLAYSHCDLDDPAEVEMESRAQLDRFRALFGRDPTHLDSHQHVHESEPVKGVAERLAAELRVPLRNRTIRYEGGFYGQSGTGEPFPEGVSEVRLIELIRSLPSGWTEIGCHPAAGAVPSSAYNEERARELSVLCSSRVSQAMKTAKVQLCSFSAPARGSGVFGPR
jgi:chitin disaccharide deacetylase